MAKLTVGTSPVALTYKGRGRSLIQNLGPGTVYFDSGSVDATTGFRLAPYAVYEFPGPMGDSSIMVVSDTANTDVRVVTLGA